MATENVDGGKATSIVRKYLEENYGNLGMLLFRVESVKPNGSKDKILVLCSLLTSIGNIERVYYYIKVDVKSGDMLEIYKGKMIEGKDEITLTKIKLPTEIEE